MTENTFDVDIDNQIKLLEKHHLKVTDWQLTRNRLENDFIGCILEESLLDLKDRHLISKDRNSSFPN